MPDYARAADTARRMIQSAGRPLAFLGLPGAPADASKPLHGPAPGEARLEPVFGAFVPLASTMQLGLSVEALGFFKGAESVALVEPPATGEDLTQYDMVEDEGRRWFVQHVEALRPGTTAVLYFVALTRNRKPQA